MEQDIETAARDSRAKDLIISIGTLGDPSVLERCLDTVFEEDDPTLSLEVWVVFNGQDERPVVEMLARKFPQVRTILRRGPLGYCKFQNLVLEHADSRYILALDDDTLLPKGTLPGMVRFMDEHANVGLAGCETRNADGSYQRSFGLAPSLSTELATAFKPDSFWPDRIYQNLSQTQDVEWLNGSFMLVRGRTVKEVGGLDEHYYTYVCEPDWAFRIRRAGWRVVYVPDFHIIHWGGEHSINNKLKVTKCVNLVRYHVNRFYFFKQHYGLMAQLLLRPLMAVGSLLRLGLYAFKFVFDPDLRPVAAVKIRAFLWVLRLCVSPRPYVLPAVLQAEMPTPGGDLPVAVLDKNN